MNAFALEAPPSALHTDSDDDEDLPMPKMTDSRRKKIQARQRRARAALRREKKAARRGQKGAARPAAGRNQAQQSPAQP
ncbi:MAG TPA: hypothetical protein VJ740_00085 [Hyphomicrobiaceae bacterium]|nr:hypothetical protein [Hyphomicrobiaceae bacterium]